MTESSDIDGLFGLPLADFTAARNALASRLRKEGRKEEAEQVKALPKPPASAWAVNQLFWHHRSEMNRLFALGEKVREAQIGGAADLRPLLDKRRQLVSQLTDRAAEILGAAGHADSRDAMRKISITLESLATGAASDLEPAAGRLTSDLEPLGFDGLAALLGGRKLQPAKVLPFRRAEEKKKPNPKDTAAARAQAREAVKTAEKSLTYAQRAAERAEAAFEKAKESAETLEAQVRELEARLKKAQEEARTAGNGAKKTAQEVADAERVLSRARAALE